MDDYNKLRAAKDHFFKHDQHSPLTREQRDSFETLDYFPENLSLKLIVDIKKLHDEKPMIIQTSTGDEEVYQRYGVFTFQVERETVKLTIFTNEFGYFLPFVDSLAGKETYGAGRYLEPEELEDGRFLVDFNLAYNPYCAYNPHWSCPLTPWENRLKVPIRAGEKIFDSEEAHP